MKYSVTYYLGTKNKNLHTITFEATDIEDAKYEAGLRIPYIHGSPIKFTITHVEEELDE